MKYCTRCLYPSTKPRLTLNEEGVCSACQAYDRRAGIDWYAREAAWRQLIIGSREHHKSPYDCVIPVSGGKDSTYQVATALKWGLRPLAVTAMTDHLTEIGQRNLDNISKMGVDHVMVHVNQKLRRKINAYTLETVGDISWAEHALIFTVPLNEAALRDIPFILYGENPENEYGGPPEAQQSGLMSYGWLAEYGGLNGLRPSDLVDAGIATKTEIYQYTRYMAIKVTAVFLGHYFPWDSFDNAQIAKVHGFKSMEPAACPAGWNGDENLDNASAQLSMAIRRGLITREAAVKLARKHDAFKSMEPAACPASWNGDENLDNAQTGIHDRCMFLKYGYGRASAQLSVAIRRGLITRKDAVTLARRCDNASPWPYCGVSGAEILDAIGMSWGRYNAIERKFANPELFAFDAVDGIPYPLFEVE